MRKPTFKKPQLGRTGGDVKLSGLKPPQFVADLYADLRDRRLLPLVALLLVAIVATPFLLGGGDGEDEFQAAPAIVEEAQAAASFAVVPAEPGLRDPARRLRHRQPRNPFAQPVAPTSGEGEGADAGIVGTVGSIDGDASVPTESAVPGGGGSSSAGASEPAPTTTTTTTITDVVIENNVTGHAIEVRGGFLGDLKREGGIEPMTTLPGEKNPVLVFVGLAEGGKGAIFLMDSNVTAYYGKAKCALDKVACATVELKPGDSATFAYGYGKTRYKLTLNRIYPIVERSGDADSVTATETEKADDPDQKKVDGKENER
ncbi:MAG TPA: hypothetical protein VD761_03410 [Solirubrobacterales bacterium]|nr:hypothetical protein [Solirubrobacterales bacterium]